MPYLGRFLGAQLFGAISTQVDNDGDLHASLDDFVLQVLKRRLLSTINSQKLNVCIEFVFPAAGENDFVTILKLYFIKIRNVVAFLCH